MHHCPQKRFQVTSGLPGAARYLAPRRGSDVGSATLDLAGEIARPVRKYLGGSLAVPITGHDIATVATVPPAVLLVVVVAVGLLLNAGCGRQSETTGSSAVESKTSGQRPASLGERSPEDEAARTSDRVKLRETWDAVYMADAKVGSIHTVFESVRQGSNTLIKARSVQKLKIRRAGQTVDMQTRIESTETERGAIRSFTVETSVGPTPLTVTGSYRNGTIHMVTTSRGNQQQRTLPWSDQHGGFFAVEQSLHKRPMEPGETRELTMLMPGVVGIQTVTSRLRAKVPEQVELLGGGSRRLLKIAMNNQIGNQELTSLCWMSPDGNILKQTVPALNQTVYRTTQDMAETPGSEEYDLFSESIVRVPSPLPHPHELSQAKYEVSLSEENPAKVFVSGGSQQIRSLTPRKAEITVHAVRPELELPGPLPSKPEPANSRPNSLIQSDDPRVAEMASNLAGSKSAPWQKCVALEKGVYEAIQTKNFGQGFATAADVVRSLEGDCTEHAVLLAALCRAESIPARVALGLVYSPADQGFAFHMWTEAWVKDRWIPLDATLGRGGIGAAHLKLRHSSLAGESAESAMLSVLQVIHQLQVDVLDFTVGPAKI